MPLRDWELKAYHYELPRELIAQQPSPARDGSRMMLLERETGTFSHHRFVELAELLPEQCCLVLNNTWVLPARLPGKRRSGARIEALLESEQSPGTWRVILLKAGRIKPGENLEFCGGSINARAASRDENGAWLLEFNEPETLRDRLEKFGLPPLPPYIQRRQFDSAQNELDRERYQTCYASVSGAIAAPTAGLHFTRDMLNKLRLSGIDICEVTLHVGRGTFAPVEVEDVREHRMHEEYFSVSPENVSRLRAHHENGRPLVSVGTTVVRVLETLANQQFRSTSGLTDIFIHPPYRFKFIDGLLTNFHLPQSTLLMLVSAFCGRENLLRAYFAAVEERYRFFSYGDCMLII